MVSDLGLLEVTKEDLTDFYPFYNIRTFFVEDPESTMRTLDPWESVEFLLAHFFPATLSCAHVFHDKILSKVLRTKIHDT